MTPQFIDQKMRKYRTIFFFTHSPFFIIRRFYPYVVVPNAEISLNYSTNQGFLSGTFVDENSIEQNENYEIEIVGEDWGLLNTTNNETITISDTEISASAW
ncbi:hypothetical protein [Exiguobacterium sp. s131]|uniref:hypothetical protein n=1 Tax=Exiguobacterium sp. s131 TaxID=2751278 RepID=UPI001BE59993|nr:hypothetical protein [Exiguobacterium sp. s131]